MASKKLNNVAAETTAAILSNTLQKKTEQKKIFSKAPKQVFSFRGEENDVKSWRLYAKITDMKVDDLGSAALKEYLSNHPLGGMEKALFDEKLNS